MEHRWLRGNSSWRWIKRQQGRPEQLPMSSGSQAMWITALGMGGPWEVIEESLCNLWKSRIKGTLPENPKWENAPSFKNGAVRNHQVTTVSSSCPGDVPLEDWAAPGSPQEAQPHPAPPPTRHTHTKQLWLQIQLTRLSSGDKSYEHRPCPALLHYIFSFSYMSNNSVISYLHLLHTYYMLCYYIRFSSSKTLESSGIQAQPRQRSKDLCLKSTGLKVKSQ